VPRPRPVMLEAGSEVDTGRHHIPVFQEIMATAPVAAFVKDSQGHYVFANQFLLTTMGKWMGPDWRGKTDAEMWPPAAAAMMGRYDRAILRGDGSQIFSHAMKIAGTSHTVLFIEFAVPIAGQEAGVGGLGFDITEQKQADSERSRLGAAIEQVAESVIITDADARITYVNPAFERVSGYRRDEAIGKNPRFLKSGIQTPWFYDAMWAALTNGLPWQADLVNRRKDGTLYTEETVISPIRDSSGAIASYVAVERDVTQERALEERATQLARERALISDTIRDLHAGDTPEVTAQAICRQVVSFTGVMAAHFYLFERDGQAESIGFVVAGQPDPPLQRVPSRRTQQIRERAAEGPWIEPWVSQPSRSYNQLLKSLGVHAVACAPVRHGRALIGLLSIYSAGSVQEFAVTEALPALVQFADLAGALIGRDVVERTEAGRGRDHIADVIARGAFGPVFQPIVELAGNRIVGYEALTRFTDGTYPESVFDQAAAVGLGLELEMATLEAALAAAEVLPQSAWLNLNATPELILAGEPLRLLLAGSRRRIVLEVTEHTAITDYPAFRAAMEALGSNVEFAVDDAGTGFASLRHIVELHPKFVKLDRSLMAGVETDSARQAMIVGLCHFAHVTRCRLIVEGIETDSELSVLRELAIELGQGYLLGRPLPLADLARQGPALGDLSAG